MTHGLITWQIDGVERPLRLTLGAYFSIDDAIEGGADAALGSMAGRSFMMADLRIVLHHLMVGGGIRPAEAATAVARLSPSEARGAALACALTMQASWVDEGQAPAAGSSERMKRGDLYKTGFAVGVKPHEVDRMTAWEWSKCVEGWNAAQDTGEKTPAPKAADMAELLARHG